MSNMTSNQANFWRTVIIAMTVVAAVVVLYAIIPAAPKMTIREGPNMHQPAPTQTLPEWRFGFKTVYPSDTAQIKFPELLPVISMLENEGLSEVKDGIYADCVVLVLETMPNAYNAQSFVTGLEARGSDRLSCYCYHVGSANLFTHLRDHGCPKVEGKMVRRTMQFDVPMDCATRGTRYFFVVKLCSKEKIPHSIFEELEEVNKHIKLKVN